MNEQNQNLLIAAGVGWFLLTYVLALGKLCDAYETQ